MKAIIYAGIGLFSAATVYGVADYYNSRKKGELDKLYAEKEAAPAPPTAEKTTATLPVNYVEPGDAEAKSVIANVKPVKKYKESKRKIKMEDFSRARIPEEMVQDDKVKEEPLKKDALIKTEAKTPEQAGKGKVEEEEEEVMERKISLEKFSRAPLKRSEKKTVLKN